MKSNSLNFQQYNIEVEEEKVLGVEWNEEFAAFTFLSCDYALRPLINIA